MRIIMRTIATAIIFATCVSGTLAQTKNARLLDEVPQIPCGHMMAVLDSFLIEWSKNKDERIAIVFYSPRYRKFTERFENGTQAIRLIYPHPDDGLNWANGIARYFVARTQLDKSANTLVREKVKLIDGGYKEDFFAELWLVPLGVDDPKPQPTIATSDVKFGAKRSIPIPNYFNCYSGY